MEPKSSSKKSNFHSLIVLLIFLVFLSISINAINNYFDPLWVKATQTHKIAQTQNFSLNWSKGDIFIRSNNQWPLLFAEEENLIFWGSQAKAKDSLLINLDITSGSTTWEQDIDNAFTGTVESFAINSQHVFVGFNSTAKTVETTMAGTGEVVAYNLLSGKRDWEAPLIGTQRLTSIVADEELLSAEGGSAPGRYFLVDAANGIQISSVEKIGPWVDDYGLSTTNYGVLYEHILRSAANESDPHFWSRLLTENKVHQPPLRKNNLILIYSDLDSTVKAFDEETGSLIWQEEVQIASNIAANDSFMFYLSDDSILEARHLRNGKSFGFIKFQPEITISDIYGVHIAANENSVVVYLGDSRQLFAFKTLN